MCNRKKKKSDTYLQLSLKMDEFQLFVWEKTEVERSESKLLCKLLTYSEHCYLNAIK